MNVYLGVATRTRLLAGKQIDTPPAYGTFKQAQRVAQQGERFGLDL